MNYMVSVIIPCYNGEKTIDRAIRSVYTQDYMSSLELIVVDDGSTDKSKLEILKWKDKFEQKNWRLQYIYQDNRGLGGAIDTGLKYVVGKYLTLLDADDRYLPSSISKKVKYLEENPDISVVRSNGWMVSGENRWLFVQDKPNSQEYIFDALLKGETVNWAGSYMVRTADLFLFYPDRNIYSSRYGQNLQLLLPLTYQSKSGFIDEPLMEYIKQENSLSATSCQEKQQEKEIRNAMGYRDIRIKVLHQITQDKEKFIEYERIIDQGYWNGVFQIAYGHKDETLFKAAYKNLKAVDGLTLQRRIEWYQIKMPMIAIMLRILRKYRILK